MRQKVIQAEPAAGGVLTSRQISCWRNEGYTFVSGLIAGDLIAQLTQAALKQFPAPGSREADQIRDFGSHEALTFPSRASGFNEVTLSENLIRAVADLLGTSPDQLRLSQSDLWPKYGRSESSDKYDNQDQRIHVDYPNHNLAHPTPWDRPEAVELILYLSDWQETAGSTAIVPRTTNERGVDGGVTRDLTRRWPIVDSPGIADLDYVNDRAAAEAYFAKERHNLAGHRMEMYERELLTAFQPGDILFYRHDSWHRGTPTKPDQLRLAQNVTYRMAHAEWINTLHVGWSWQAYSKDKFLERLIATSSLLQRAVLGFPQPGSPYWCKETYDGVAARYQVFGMDMSPYRFD